MAEGATLDQILSSMATMELASIPGLAAAYPNMPTKVDGNYPCTVRAPMRGTMTHMGGGIANQPIGGTGPLRVRVHQVKVALLVGKRNADNNIAALVNEAAKWVDPVDTAYLAHQGLSSSVQRAEVIDYGIAEVELNDGKHFGLTFTVQVTARPVVTNAM